MSLPRAALAAGLSVLFAAEARADAFSAVLAQVDKMDRGPGFYVNLYKFVPIVLLYLIWVWTTAWVDRDARELGNENRPLWNAAVFFSGIVGLALVLLVPFYLVGLILLLIVQFGTLLFYLVVRDKDMHYEDKILTSYNLGEVFNDLIRSMGGKGPFNRPKKDPNAGPEVKFIPKGVSNTEESRELVEEALASEEIEAAKELVFDAVTRRATDVLMEPAGDELAVKYRIDGILHVAEPFDRTTGDAVLGIIKVFSGLDVNERRKPQEGAFAAKIEKRDVEFRVAVSGTKAGENMVLRLTDNSATIAKLEDTGMRAKFVERIREIVTSKRGLFICAGTPASGKTSTLYACVRAIDRFQNNILTLEDLIEHPLDNVQQMVVDLKQGEQYAERLRSAIRQEPDVLMFGELKDRDVESATVLCQGAAAGRMMLTSMNATDTIEALFKLLDMGVDPQALANSLSGIVAQRLVRLLCETCKEPYKPKPEALKKLNLPAAKIDVFYRPPKEVDPEIGPCPDCGGTGYLGRTGIFELLDVNDSLRELIRENPSANAIRAEARKNGMIYLQEDGMRQVIQGRTSIEELKRVVK